MTRTVDLRCVLRGFARQPWSTAMVIAGVAVGSGTSVALLGFVGGLAALPLDAAADPAAAPRLAQVAWVLATLSGLALAVTFATFAGQLLSRATARDAETATRIALGGRLRDVASVFVIEAMLMAIAGTALGALAGWWTARMFPLLFYAEDAEQIVTAPHLRWSAAIASTWFLSLVLTAIAPLVVGSHRAPWPALREGPARAARSASALRRGLTVASIGAVVLMLLSVSTVNTILPNRLRTPRGDAVGELVVARVEGSRRGFTRVEDAVRRVAGVSAIGWTSSLPGFRPTTMTIAAERAIYRERALSFEVLTLAPGDRNDRLTPVVTGRGLVPRDIGRGAVVNEMAAQRYFGGQAVGQVMEDPAGGLVEIVGVVRLARPTAAPTLIRAGKGSTTQPAPRTLLAESGADRRAIEMSVVSVSGTYFELMGDPIVAGTGFDQPGQACVIEERAASALFDGPDVDGFLVDAGGARHQVSGLVRNLPVGIAQRAAPPLFVVPMTQWFSRRMTLLARTDRSAATRTDIERAIASVDDAILLRPVSTFDEEAARAALAPERIVRTLLATTVGATLLLAVIGLSGTMTDVVSARRRELAIRLALGAPSRGIVISILRQAATLASTGAVLGSAAFLGIRPLLSMLLEQTPRWSATPVLAAVLIFAAIVLASVLAPARAALRLQLAQTIK